jgi:hypothetical protein
MTVLSVLSWQHTNREWNPCRVVEVYRQLQIYSANNFDIDSKQKNITTIIIFRFVEFLLKNAKANHKSRKNKLQN